MKKRIVLVRIETDEVNKGHGCFLCEFEDHCMKAGEPLFSCEDGEYYWEIEEEDDRP